MKTQIQRSYLDFVAVALGLLVGCGPARVEPIVEIKPSETGFVVGLEQDTMSGQDKLDSKQALLDAKIATKRITIPVRQRNTGRAWWNFEYIPTQMVIVVDRTPVTREWTRSHHEVHNGQGAAIEVESRESLGFSLGVNITTEIKEENAHNYLYYFGAAADDDASTPYLSYARSLAEITDEVVHGYIQSQAAEMFGRLEINEVTLKQNVIIDKILENTRKYFEPRGITIVFLGWRGGIRFENQSIQEQIDQVQVAASAVNVARTDQLVELTNEETEVERARATRDAALKLYAGREAAVFAMGLEIQRMRARASLNAAERWNGVAPRLAPVGAPINFGLDTPTDARKFELDVQNWPSYDQLMTRLGPKLQAEEAALENARKMRQEAQERVEAAVAAPPVPLIPVP